MTQTIQRLLALLMLVACLGSTLLFSQIIPNDYQVFQNGVEVGEIYVPAWSSRELFAEHWILYPNYVYPNARNGVRTLIVPNPNKSYAN